MTREPVEQPDLLATLQPTVAKNFNRPRELLAAEMWLAERLKAHGVTAVFSGITDHEIRKQRFRQAIVDGGLQQVMACANSTAERRAQSYAEAFEEMYGEPLELGAAKRAKRKAVEAKQPQESATAVAADDDDIPF